ncbi:IS5 family transposase [Flammeovirgaceae bacterium SG7u.111]|nr:IS5 family transposase [Flammeovirgaceae bacterium SG7u.132]WPO37533.1 IS5 family transposase [Flammeovirgaceae bacterium SG7u.111]
METDQSRLTAQQWEYIKECLPVQRKRKYDLRDVVDGIFYILRTGMQWRNLSGGYPPWQSVYYYFRRWKQDNTLERINAQLNKKWRVGENKKETPSMLSIDSQSVRCAPFIGQDTGIDGNKKVDGRKRHVVTDTLGLVWGVLAGPANEPDGAAGQRVADPLLGYLDRIKKILADHAYKEGFMGWVEENIRGVGVEISSCPPTAKGFVPIKWRWVTERTFGTLNFFRRLSKDYEKTTKSQEAWVLWQNCQIILNRLKRKHELNF